VYCAVCDGNGVRKVNIHLTSLSMPLDRMQFELMYEDRDRPVSPYSQIAAIRLHDRLGQRELRELPCYACQGRGKFLTMKSEGVAYWEREPEWFAALRDYAAELVCRQCRLRLSASGRLSRR
jgi:hypothetical protein